MIKIHCLNPISPKGLDELTDSYVITDTLDEAQGILVRSAPMLDLTFSKELNCIARAGAGVNNIPLDVCSEQGIVVFNTPGANANGVKELVIASMLLACRDLVGGIEWCRNNAQDANITKTTEKEKKNFAGTEIQGKTLGVIGLGAIGAKVANAAISLGMKVIGYDPFISIHAAWSLSSKVEHATDINALLEKSDFITLHLPLTSDSKGMINSSIISKMKVGTVLLNFSRDTLVNEEDLHAAIESGIVRKYITDFPNPTIMKMKNTIVIPHLGASTEESEDNCAHMAVLEMMDYIENGNIKNSVNYPSCDMGICSVTSRLAILHKNIPNMIGQITQTLAKYNLNISNLMNNSKGQFAYTLIDLENEINETLIQELNSIEGISKVRALKKM